MTYQVKLPVFEGPFDLLLHLISKRELDIYEVSLSEITEEYVATIKQMQDLDLEVATEFLVVAATLIEIKAARLLPGPPVDEEEALALSERDLLIARLLEYKAFKDAAGRLLAMMEANASYLARTAGPGPEFEKLAPDLLARVTPERFADVAVRALTPKPVPVLDLSHISPIRVSVAEAIQEMRDALRARATISFRKLTAHCSTRIDLVVRFLAVLELVKRGEADVAQANTFGDIQVTRLELENADEDPAAIDEYEGTPVDEPGSEA